MEKLIQEFVYLPTKFNQEVVLWLEKRLPPSPMKSILILDLLNEYDKIIIRNKHYEKSKEGNQVTFFFRLYSKSTKKKYSRFFTIPFKTLK